MVPWALVACEPTIAAASASAVNRSRNDRVEHDLLVGRERAEPKAAA